MIVIGADTHKGSHALAAVDEGTGRVRGSREIKADDAGHLSAVRWAQGMDDDRVWAIEDCRHVSGRLEQALLAAGERVVRVPPQRMGASRRGEREPGKSDQIDALAVARAVVEDGVQEFPVAYLNGQAMEIRLLLDHRSDLVAERTRTVNRLRWHLVTLCPELEASLKRKALNDVRGLDRVDRQLRKLHAGARGASVPKRTPDTGRRSKGAALPDWCAHPLGRRWQQNERIRCGPTYRPYACFGDDAGVRISKAGVVSNKSAATGRSRVC